MLKRILPKISSAVLTVCFCLNSYSIGVLEPKGIIAKQQHKLLFDTIALMMIVVIPVIIMSFAFAYEFNKKEEDGSIHLSGLITHY